MTAEQLQSATPLPGSAEPRREWVVEEVVTVSVADDEVWDPEAGPVPAVVVRMPAHVARHLACLLDDWTTIGRILESARGTDERDLAGALHEAARAAEAEPADAS